MPATPISLGAIMSMAPSSGGSAQGAYMKQRPKPEEHYSTFSKLEKAAAQRETAYDDKALYIGNRRSDDKETTYSKALEDIPQEIYKATFPAYAKAA
tara:strand:- start:483 stop:773 length:291 start_codon:yes stop_codon:yes gene_type:complete